MSIFGTGDLPDQLAGDDPVSVCHCFAQVIYLTSLQEMTLVDMNNRGVASKLQIESEPSFCGLGPNHAAVGMNNQVSPVCLCVYI